MDPQALIDYLSKTMNMSPEQVMPMAQKMLAGSAFDPAAGASKVAESSAIKPLPLVTPLPIAPSTPYAQRPDVVTQDARDRESLQAASDSGIRRMGSITDYANSFEGGKSPYTMDDAGNLKNKPLEIGDVFVHNVPDKTYKAEFKQPQLDIGDVEVSDPESRVYNYGHTMSTGDRMGNDAHNKGIADKYASEIAAKTTPTGTFKTEDKGFTGEHPMLQLQNAANRFVKLRSKAQAGREMSKDDAAYYAEVLEAHPAWEKNMTEGERMLTKKKD